MDPTQRESPYLYDSGLRANKGESTKRSVLSLGAVLVAVTVSSLGLAGCIVASPGHTYLWGGQGRVSVGLVPTEQSGAPSGVTSVDSENTFNMVVVGGTLYTSPGLNTYCDRGVGRTGHVSTWTPILTNVVATSGGNSWGIALRWDGTVWVWGHQQHYWNLGTGQANDQCSPEQVPGLSNIVSVAGGGQHGLAISASGNVYAWGTNEDGDLALPASVAGEATPVTVMTGVTGGRVTAGHLISAVWVPGGPGWAFGQDTYGQLGVGYFASGVYSPTPIVGFSSIQQLSWGGDFTSDGHSLLLDTRGKAYAAGDNASGQLGDGTTTNSSTFTPVSGLPTIASVSAGGQHSMFLGTNGVVYACGSNSYGQVGNDSTANVLAPAAVLFGALHMDAGAEQSLASS